MTEFIDENFGEISAPFNAGFELTAKCNLNCIHCYANHDRNHKDFTTEEFKQLFDILVDKGLLEVYFTGGEVFLRPDFEELYIYAKEKGVSVVLLSNITMLTQKHIDLFYEYPVELISTTMYGYSEKTYETVTQVKGSYKKFIAALELLRKNNIRFELKFVGMRQNIGDLYKVRELGRELGVEMVVSLDIHPMSDGTLDPMKYKIPAEEAFEFDVKDVGRNAFWKGVAKELLFGEIGIRPDRASKRFEAGYLYPCSIAHQFVFITSDYQMQGCVRASYRKFDLRKGTFDDGWKYLQEQLTYKKSSPLFLCKSCDKIRFCEQCCANFAQEYGDEEQVDPYYCKIAALRKELVDGEIKRILSQPKGI
jgi:MoaA/NifB/PqqE/SkfB family radical SAM enzyme